MLDRGDRIVFTAFIVAKIAKWKGIIIISPLNRNIFFIFAINISPSWVAECQRGPSSALILKES